MLSEQRHILFALAFVHSIWYVLTPVIKIDEHQDVTINMDILVIWRFNLSEIKSDSRLKNLALVRHTRLSVMPVQEKEYKIIVEELGKR